MRTQVLEVDPELAKKWLATARNKRSIRESVVDFYAIEMKSGQWKLNGEAIKFENGNLVDGQHRLSAIVKSGKKVDLLVAFDVQEGSEWTLDTGTRRSAGDYLSMRGYNSAIALAGAVRFVKAFRAGLSTDGSIKTSHVLGTLTYREIETFVQRNKSIEDSVKIGWKVKELLPPATAAGLHFLFSEKDATMADLFFESLATGVNLAETEPVFQLRKKLLHYRMSDVRLPRRALVENVIYAWNLYRGGKSVKKFAASRIHKLTQEIL